MRKQKALKRIHIALSKAIQGKKVKIKQKEVREVDTTGQATKLVKAAVGKPYKSKWG